jgi:HPt (histidine-containing phosphotransfer) domain-containing protein
MLDQNAIKRLEDWGGPSLAGKMIRLFLATSRQRVAQVRDGLNGSGLEVAERGAHSLKSSAANLGATRLQELSASIEGLLAEGDREGAAALMEELEAALVDTLAALRALEEALP